MREYRFQATDGTVEQLRRLRGAWTGFTVSDLVFTVMLADGSAVRVQVEAADVEDAFEAFRIEAHGDTPEQAAIEAVLSPLQRHDPGDFADGGNDVVLFTGATWSEPGAEPTGETVASGAMSYGQVMHFSGHPGQLSETAEVVCITTDAIVVATARGTGILVRTGLKPLSLMIVRDPEVIATFLTERGYRTE